MLITFIGICEMVYKALILLKKGKHDLIVLMIFLSNSNSSECQLKF